MNASNEVEFLLRTPHTRRVTTIVVVVGIVLAWLLAFFLHHDTQLVCQRHDYDETCTLRTRYPIGESDRTFPIARIRGARTHQYQVKNGTRWEVLLDVGEDTLSIDTWNDRESAEAEEKSIRLFLAGTRDASFATPADPNGPSVFVSAVIATPITLLLLLVAVMLLESATVIVDVARRRVRLVRHFVLFRTTRELELDEVAGAVVQNTRVPTKGGSLPVSNAWLVGADGKQLAAVHFEWATRGLCDEPAQRLDALLKMHSRARSKVVERAPEGAGGTYRAPVGAAPTELESIATHPPPRDRSFVEPYLRKVEPPWSFALLGFFFAYFSLCAWCAVGVVGLLAFVALTGTRPPPGPIVALFMLLGVAAFVGVWMLFLRIVRRRRARAARLYTHGVLVDGSFARVNLRAGETTMAYGANVAFTPTGEPAKNAQVRFHGMHAIAGGERCSVLYEPSQKKIVVFALEGEVAGSAMVGALR